MTASLERPLVNPGSRGRLWWLPAEGFGNGLTAPGWAPIADVDARVVSVVLNALRAGGVPAYASPTHTALQRFVRHEPVVLVDRVWVGTATWSQAEQTLMHLLLRLPDLLTCDEAATGQ